ncbi:MAG TPA: alpha/beta hydrolase [Nocardioidaceae bacterium]
MPDELRTDLNVRRAGRPSNEAPTLFLLHGLTDSSAGWGPAVRRWQDDYCLLLVDQRGHGDSPRFTAAQLEGHPGDLLVEDALALLGQLGESPVVVGHSLGGAVALEAAVRRPDLVRTLVLEDPAPLGPDEPQHRPERGAELVDSLADSVAASDDAALVAARRRKHPTWTDDELLATGRAEQQTDRDFVAHGDWKPSSRWPDLFKELIVPALVVSGDAPGEICVDEEMERGTEQIGNPNLRLVRVTGAGHCVRRERPDRFYEVVEEFLATH